ncbi:MAG: 5-(carboxyamino)imidazole ribonucleotide mutase [Phycisphaerae bacterium]|nr:5-(carboxyamino)imidazole ribonucleotide mutase [Phycisphaerae bacterium]
MSEPRVIIVMGSDSDWPTMKKCYDLLQEFDITCKVQVASAHRTPAQAMELASTARDKGVQVIIAAAGMAAHLGGVIAAHTTLPVIGVPMSGGMLDGLDALLSTVQMPPGIPVATVGVGSAGAKNAALLAVQMMGIADKTLAEKMAQYKKDMADTVIAKNAKLQKEL